MVKKITLSVIDFALPAPCKGSIDIHSGFGRVPQQGLDIHQMIQREKKEKHPRYEAEVAISHDVIYEDYHFTIAGRMDGIYHGKRLTIEEIKSTFNIFELRQILLNAQEEHPYCLQLKTYGYFHWLQKKEIPTLLFHLVSSRNGETKDIELTLDIHRYEQWLDRRLRELIAEARLAEQTIQRRKQSALDMNFPFTTPRTGQIELMQTIEEGMQEHRPMLVQAPTGLGKTIGVLYPVMTESLARGQKVIYATPKNSQHSIAEDAVLRLQATGAKIKSLTLTAKNKMCFKNETLCNSKYCEFAKDHYTKIATHGLQTRLHKKKNLTANIFKKMAKKYEVCPFELQFEAIKHVDVIVCDYNYVFAPRAAFSDVAIKNIGENDKHNLIIDEAHNLPSRALEYYSPALSITTFEKMLTELDTVSKDHRKKVERLLRECITIVTQCASKEILRPCKIKPPVLAFMNQDDRLREFLSKYLNSDVIIEPGDLVIRLSYYWSEFTAALEFISTNRPEFFSTFHPHPPTVKITCCDASKMLKDTYAQYAQVVGFSATLKPFEFYSQLTGIDSKKLKTAEFVSPFPVQNRKIIVIPQVSSKYADRQRNYPRVAEIIEKITALKFGNYFAFFPSFDFLDKTLKMFKPEPRFEVLRQFKGMNKDDIQIVIDRLKDNTKPRIVFAVQGGIFSEGMDYPGNMVIGAFIIGTALPNFDLERETMKVYYDRHYQTGTNYAYTYPAMTKAIQAAGRVIRSETDKGIIVLLDDRFLQPAYSQCMPVDWFNHHPNEIVSKHILQDIVDFWADT